MGNINKNLKTQQPSLLFLSVRSTMHVIFLLSVCMETIKAVISLLRMCTNFHFRLTENRSSAGRPCVGLKKLRNKGDTQVDYSESYILHIAPKTKIKSTFHLLHANNTCEMFSANKCGDVFFFILSFCPFPIFRNEMMRSNYCF